MALVSGSGLNLTLTIIGSIASAAGIGNATQAINLVDLSQMLGGTGAGQIDTVYEATTTLGASASVTLDLNTGGLLDPFGVAASFGHVKAIAIISDPSSLADLVVGNATTPVLLGFGAAANTWAVSPGEMLVATKEGASAVGWVVTNTTADGLKITNGSGGSSKFQIIVLGTST
jgi:hypothetical protein